MRRDSFHNTKLIKKNLEFKNFDLNTIEKSKIIVDINKILNRVKVEKKTAKIKDFKFYTFMITAVFLFAFFLFY